MLTVRLLGRKLLLHCGAYSAISANCIVGNSSCLLSLIDYSGAHFSKLFHIIVCSSPPLLAMEVLLALLCNTGSFQGQGSNSKKKRGDEGREAEKEKTPTV